MKVDNKLVDLFYDLFDKACMTYYYDLNKMDYLNAFNAFTKALVEGEFDYKIPQKTVNKLQKIIDKINEKDFNNEEVRLASELVLIKGYKHRNMNLDFLTPDAISYIFSFIINAIVKKEYQDKPFAILDTVIGAGNLLFTITNNLEHEDVSCFGIEKDPLFAGIAYSMSLLTNNDLIVSVNDAKDRNGFFADVIIGDFGENEDIYDIIIERLNNILNKGYFVYLINNDFFQKASDEFRKTLLDHSTLLGLVVLPQTFVAKNHVGKSILIGKKELLSDYQMSVIQIDDDLSQESLLNFKKKIEKIFK